MADIGREANVNRITVSRALSRPDLVAEDTLRRIQEVIAKTGYIPDQIARGLKSEHSRIVSLITPPQMSGVYGAILERFAFALYESGLIVNLFPVLAVDDQRQTVFREVSGWRPAAIVLFGIQLTDESQTALLSAHAPIVELLNYDENAAGTCVGYDQREAAQSLATHLLDQGYEKICYVHFANSANPMNTLRLQGFAEAIRSRKGSLFLRGTDDGDPLQAMEAAQDSSTEITGVELKSYPTFQAGYTLMERLAERKAIPEALLFASDMVAVGALQYCIAHGLRPRKDVGICAFDGTELTAIVRPSLTSLDLPYERVIQYGAEQIVRHVRDRSAPPEHIKIPTRVLHREST